MKRRAKFSVLLQIRFWWVFPSLLNLNICTANCTAETEWIQREKDALNSLASSWNVSFELSFCGGKTKFTHAIAAKKEQTLTTSNKIIWLYLQLHSSPFTYWSEVNLRTLVNRRWELIILSVGSLTVFEENIVLTILTELVPLFFQKCTCTFYSYALSNGQVSVCDRYL